MLGEDEFSELMTPIVAYCKDGKDMDEVLAAVYYAKLKDLTPGAFQLAVDHWLSTNSDRWLPSIPELKELALEYQNGRRMHWQEAWSRILEAADIFSPHCKHRADRAHQIVGPDLMEHVRILGGFLAIMEASTTTLSVKQTIFRETYQRTEREKIERQMLPEGMRVPHKVIVQHTAARLGLPAPEEKP